LGNIVRDWVITVKSGGPLAVLLPVGVREGKLWISGPLVGDGVPNGVELIGTVLLWERERVAAAVSLWVLLVDSRGGVQRLMDVADVVDHESESGGKPVDLLRGVISVVHNLLVLVGTFVALGMVEPVGEPAHGLSDVVVVHLEVVVIDAATLVEEWLVDEVPSGLESSSFGLDIVSERSTLNHWVLVFVGSELGVRFLEDGKSSLDIGDGLWALLLKDIVGNSGDEEMAGSVPSTGAVDQGRSHK